MTIHRYIATTQDIGDMRMAEMSEEDKDFLAVRIKHHGQCPYEKGHSDGEFAAGVFLGAMFAFGIVFWNWYFNL